VDIYTTVCIKDADLYTDDESSIFSPFFIAEKHRKPPIRIPGSIPGVKIARRIHKKKLKYRFIFAERLQCFSNKFHQDITHRAKLNFVSLQNQTFSASVYNILIWKHQIELHSVPKQTEKL